MPTPPDPPCIYTIGHSNHDETTFLALLRQHHVEVLADVRSQPYSRYTPHFNTEPLKIALAAEGIGYVFLGDQLGGRPEPLEFYDADGHVRYDRLAESAPFRDGIRRLQQGIARFQVALMCGEEDPAECHRNLLVGRVLSEEGVSVFHIRGDGRVQSQAELDRALGGGGRQPLLFDDWEAQPWRSTRSVSPRRPRGRSSPD